MINNLIKYEQDLRGGVSVILTVTLNPAVDVTYLVDRLVPRSAATVASARQRAGGKGVNVARVAAACGADVCATGLAGGSRGEMIVAWLAEQGVPAAFEPIAGESRQTLTIVETGRGSAGRGGAAGHPTELREIGPVVTSGEWSRFLDRFAGLAAAAGVVVLSGSLPPGVPDGAYAALTGIARRAGSPVILDTGGPALRLACAAGPDIVKPNESELMSAAGPAGDGIGGGHWSGPPGWRWRACSARRRARRTRAWLVRSTRRSGCGGWDDGGRDDAGGIRARHRPQELAAALVHRHDRSGQGGRRGAARGKDRGRRRAARGDRGPTVRRTADAADRRGVRHRRHRPDPRSRRRGEDHRARRAQRREGVLVRARPRVRRADQQDRSGHRQGAGPVQPGRRRLAQRAQPGPAARPGTLAGRPRTAAHAGAPGAAGARSGRAFLRRDGATRADAAGNR